MGCDAWGVDVSDYAVANTCAPGYVLKASTTDIPFKDGRFDVVHSQGVFEYLSESEIGTALQECRRVGKHQVHIADHCGSEIDEENFVTRKPREWWASKFESAEILVACPVHLQKSYSLERWLRNVFGFDCRVDVVIADTTEDDSLRRTFEGRAKFLEVGGGWGWRHVARAMNAIREYFLANPNYRYWFNVESDILPPKDCIEKMLRHEADWISHCFPRRLGDHSRDFDQGIGCSMLSRRLMENFKWPDTEDTPDSVLWEQVRPLNKFSVVELWGLFQCQHLIE